MLSRFAGAVMVFVVAQADEVKGKVKKVDADKSVLTLSNALSGLTLLRANFFGPAAASTITSVRLQ